MRLSLRLVIAFFLFMPMSASTTETPSIREKLAATEARILKTIREQFKFDRYLGQIQQGTLRPEPEVLADLLILAFHLDWMVPSLVIESGLHSVEDLEELGVEMNQMRVRLLFHLDRPVLEWLLRYYQEMGVETEFQGHPLPQSDIVEALNSQIGACSRFLQ